MLKIKFCFINSKFLSQMVDFDFQSQCDVFMPELVF